MSYPNFIFSVFSFFGFIVCCIPFAGQMKAGNTGTCLYMVWTGLACLNQFVNSIIWNDNTINHAPIWCDISSRFIVGAAVAIPACSLCINRRLYHIASSRDPLDTAKGLPVLVDFGIGIGLPAVAMALQYIPQGHRFNIYQEIGCYPFTNDNPVGIALVWAPPIAIGCLSSIYSVLNIHTFFIIQPRLSRILEDRRSPARYIRLVFISCVYGIFVTPLTAIALYLHCTFGNATLWRGLEESHANISHVDQISSVQWRQNPGLEVDLEFSRWLVVAFAFVFFALFGLAEEARERYLSYFYFLAGFVSGCAKNPASPNHDPTLTLTV